MKNLNRMLAPIAALALLLISVNASAQSAFTSHASVCEAIRPANGHKLLHSREGLENISNQSIWVSCPITTELYLYPSNHFFLIVAVNLKPQTQRVNCILRYYDHTSGVFRSVSNNKTIGALGGAVYEWDVSVREIAQPNISCKMSPGIGLSLVSSVSG